MVSLLVRREKRADFSQKGNVPDASMGQHLPYGRCDVCAMAVEVSGC